MAVAPVRVLWTRRRRFWLSAAVVSLLAVVGVAVALVLGVWSEGPDTFAVTKTEDTNDGVCDDDCSLREAIAAAGTGDIVTIPEGTYNLTLGSELVIDKDLTVVGAGPELTSLQAAESLSRATHRVLRIVGRSPGQPDTAPARVVRISGISIRHGTESGGGVRNERGELTLSDTTVSENGGPVNGGGIWNDGTLEIEGSEVSTNTASTSGGIYNDGILILTNTLIQGNRAAAGGGIINFGTLTLNGSTVSNNTAWLRGGGIWNQNKMSMTNSTITGNQSLTDNAGPQGSTAFAGSEDAAGFGGGIFNQGLAVSLVGSDVSFNSANFGGGIYNFDERRAGNLRLVNSTMSGNTAADGGGIYNSDGPLDLTNTTVSGNEAKVSGGGIFNGVAGSLTLSHATVSQNQAGADGGGIYNSRTEPVEIINAIIAGNLASSGPDCSGALISLGHNLLRDSSGCTFPAMAGDLVGSEGMLVEPLLGPLGDNGGPTLTHALLRGSPAIDAGDGESTLEADQRGVSRPQGVGSDMGAFELEPVKGS